MVVHKVLVLVDSKLSEIGSHIAEYFEADVETDSQNVAARLAQTEYKAIVFDCIKSGHLNSVSLRVMLKMEEVCDLPVVVLSEAQSLQDKLDALEIGADDFIEPNIQKEEACARVTKAIFHRVAADQLASRLELANQTAHTALIDNSDLGANIQFLINAHDCDNLDQLGQMFFTTISRYGLKCSLQLRGDYEIKNMEAHGMAKDLESQMLTQLKGGDRYIDFGSRTIVNYDRVSLLIKNMPSEDPDKYGAIKDNTFALIQGMNARVHSLENQAHLLEERETLKKLANDVRKVMTKIQSSYQSVMRDIATEVDNASEAMLIKLPSFALTEPDEAYIENVMAACVKNTTMIFNEGLKVDEAIQRLEGTIGRSLEAVNVDEAHKAEDQKQHPAESQSDSTLELF